MDVLGTFLTCYQILTDPLTDLELDVELTDKIAEKCAKYLKGKQPKKPRFENIVKYTRNEIFMMDDDIPSPDVDHVLEVAIDQVLGKINF